MEVPGSVQESRERTVRDINRTPWEDGRRDSSRTRYVIIFTVLRGTFQDTPTWKQYP